MNIRILYLIVTAVIFFSCKEKQPVRETELIATEEGEILEKLEDIPLVTDDIGEFPFYIMPPTGYQYDNNTKEMNFDELYRFYNDSSTLTIGGKFYETGIIKTKQNREKNYNDSLLLAYFDRQIKDLGGVETRLKQKYSHFLTHQQAVDSVKRYIIRTIKGNIWIDLISLHTPRQINYSIIYEGKVSEPVHIIKAERLKYALEKYGKVIVYINFADGKTSLEPDGIQAVNEIARLMNRLDKDLKLSVEGHTDDAGSAEYCKRLSNERVSTILNQLQRQKVQSYRLKKVAYGSERFVADNSTNENRAKNRRIELIKINVDETGLRNAIDRDGKAVLQITFESGRSTLRPDGMDIVDQIAKLMTTDKTLKLSIEGHTDNAGSADMNRKLSLDRANAVINRLIELGIERKRLKASGYGLERPLVPNNSNENREKNRRVEIIKIN